VTPRDALGDANIYYGWIVVAACFVAVFAGFGISYSFGIFFTEMLAAFGRSHGATSLAFALQTFVLYIGAAVFGNFVDKIGVRRLMAVGVTLFAIGLLTTARAGSLRTIYLTYGFITALGMGILFIVAYGTIPRWFDRRRGTAMGLTTAGLGTGMVVLPVVSQWLIAQADWRIAFTALATPLTFALVVATYLMSGDPEEVGADLSLEFDGQNQAGDSTGAQLSEHVTRPAFAFAFTGWTLVFATLYVVFSHLAAYTSNLGLGAWVGALSFSLIGVTGIAARLGVGYLSDRIGVVTLFIACSTVMAVVPLLLSQTTAVTPILVLAVLFGCGYGGADALLSPLTAELFGETSLFSMLGLMGTAFALSGLTSPYLAGHVYDLVGSYRPAFVGVGFLGLCGAGSIALADRYVD
jgi:MFS family permease